MKILNHILMMLIITFILFGCKNSIEEHKERYVVLSPEIAEILASLGVSDRIVGRTFECDYPLELQDIPSVGNFGQFSLERIMSLNPSIVFTSALEQNEITEQLKRLNIQTLQFYPRNTLDLLVMIDSLGVITGTQVTADSLSQFIQSSFENFRNSHRIRRGYSSEKPKIYTEIYGNPIMSADNSSYLGQLLEYTGAENIFPQLIRDYARVNAEEVVLLNPDVIILTYPGISAEDIKQRKGWGTINATLNDRIYTIDDINPDLILRAGPRNIRGIERLIEVIYNGD